ncbi:aminotransferase class IV [Pantoea ananatis]
MNPPDGFTTDVIIAAFPWGAYLGALKRWKRRVLMRWFPSWNRVAPNTRATTAAATGGNYLSSLLVGSEARRHGYRLRHRTGTPNGLILRKAQAKTSFEVKDGVLFTPPFTSSALPGITRGAIITLARDMGIEVREQTLSRESLYLADEVFMSGTAARNYPQCVALTWHSGWRSRQMRPRHQTRSAGLLWPVHRRAEIQMGLAGPG